MKSPKDYTAAAQRCTKSLPPSDPFLCAFCGKSVPAAGSGTRHRNHCPHCLSSVHLDDVPGDRGAHCGGVMDAVGVWVREGGEWAILHRCRICGAFHSNRVAADDNPALLLQLAAKPLAEPPFPLKYLDRLLQERSAEECDKM